ncbi:hypothetical protein [uncultured Aliiroseovarius sp.]|uniref:hypothetical protein n=1 Tax=uncultured Aliiroseovarius sp. TaxID=1658783 RepID=UPI002599CF14|nr:hypothetical protein [uncultured Aliiroseovarius sp.]
MTDQGDNAGRWPVWAVALVLYPLAAGAAAVNLFFLFLILHAVGFDVLTPVQAIVGGIILGVPFTWVAGKWIHGLIQQAEDEA